ncbi:MAG: hypothetical protein ACNA7K_05170 [Acholeplasmataceae bacterium]
MPDHPSRELALFFEKLRFQRQMSQEEFATDIVSLRQYRRYLNGDCEIPYRVLNQFSEKLGFKSEHVILELESERLFETRTINAFYNAVANQDMIEADRILKDIDKRYILDKSNITVYEHALNLYRYNQKKINLGQLIDHTKQLINYPKILSNKTMSSAELIILSSLLNYPDVEQRDGIVEKLNEVINNTVHIISGLNDRMTLLILFRLAKYTGAQKDFETTLNYCNKAISYNQLQHMNYLLDYFYYYKALCHYRLQEVDAYEHSVYQCYNILEVSQNKSKKSKFKTLIEEDFKIDLDLFIINYTQKLLKKASPN